MRDREARGGRGGDEARGPDGVWIALAHARARAGPR